MGLAIAEAAAVAGAEVIIASQSSEKLDSAVTESCGELRPRILDICNESEVEVFFNEIKAFDHLVISAAAPGTGLISKMKTELAHKFFDTKFWGAYYCAKYGAPHLSHKGSITFISGVASRSPMIGLSVAGACNGALESLGRSLALEFSPIRVNTISPGLINTPLYSKMPDEQRTQLFESTAIQLPAQRIGQSQDIASVALMLMENGFISGSVIDVDGGALIA